MPTSVKYFHSEMTGAPVLNGTAGSLISVLDACLVNGFNARAVDSIVVTNGIATATVSAGHGYTADHVVLISGATPAALNGEQRITSVTQTTFTFAVSGVPDGAASGTIGAKIAPLGFEKPFSGTNLAVYRSGDLLSTRMLLRVDDTGAQNARVVGYETMADINTGTGPFPVSTQISGGGYWPKANSTSTTARGWTIIGDGRAFYLHVHTRDDPPNRGTTGVVFGFGDFLSLRSGDTYGAFLACHAIDVSTSTSTGAGLSSGYIVSSLSRYVYVPRSYTMIGTAIECNHYVESYQGNASNESGNGAGVTISSYPNPVNNGLILSRKSLIEMTLSVLRGYLPGIYHAPQNLHAAFNWRDKIDGQGSMLGRKLMAVKTGSPANNVSQGCVFFDITGPWR